MRSAHPFHVISRCPARRSVACPTCLDIACLIYWQSVSVALQLRREPARTDVALAAWQHPLAHRQQQELSKTNHAFGNKLYRVKAMVDTSAPKFFRSGPLSPKPQRASPKHLSHRTSGGGDRHYRQSHQRDSDYDDDDDPRASPFAPGRPFSGKVLYGSTSPH